LRRSADGAMRKAGHELTSFRLAPETGPFSESVGSRLRRLSDQDGRPHGWGKRRKGLPIDLLRKDHPELRLAGLMGSRHGGAPPVAHECCRRSRTSISMGLAPAVRVSSEIFPGRKRPDNLQAGCFSTPASIGILRRRLPVAAKTALAMAGTIADVPVSPMPPGGSELFTT
jgi:hypothetical protein